MKRVSTWLTTICLMVLCHANLFAASVDSTRAKQLALSFFSTITKTSTEQLLAEGVSLAYSAYADEVAEPQANTVCFYVINVGKNGFVMLSGDDRIKPILGYSYESSFSTKNMPENLRDWLDVKRREISSALVSGTLFASSEIIYQWNHLPEIGTTMSVVVQPLLQTEWDQNSYYNQHCPEDADGPNGHAYAGCVATAMAQIIRYWEWPWAGFDSHNYTCNYGNLSVDFSSANYNYNNMPYSINGGSSYTQIDAVATLIYHCGVSVDMDYGPNSSSAYSRDAYTALNDYFAYPPGMSYQSKSDYSSTEWNNMLRNELNNSRPVLYSGQGTGGHSFICDGYDNNGTYHFNWGWSGYFNGYFALNALTPTTGHNYSDRQTAIFGISASGSFIRCSSNNLLFNASIGGSGMIKTVDVRGHSLNGNINVTAGNGYSVGTTANSFSNSVSIPAQGGRLYVKYTPTLSSPGNQNANIILVSGTVHDTVFCYGSAFDEVCLPPQNLTGIHTGSQVQLSWSEPVNYGSGPDAVNISWDSTVALYTLGYGSNMTVCMMQRFDVDDLTPYQHYLLKSISFIPTEEGTSFRLVVYKGGHYNNGYYPGTQIVNQEIPAACLVRDTWNTVQLNSPLLVNAAEELWFGFMVYTTGTNGFVMPVSTGNYVANKGCVCGVSGGYNDGTGYFYWTDLSDHNVNFPIKGRLEQISANVLRYEVYRNATQIGNTTSTTYTDYSPIFSNCEYTVSAVWDNSCSQSSSVILNPPAVSLPTVITGNVSNITATTATCGGEVTSSGGSTVTACGVCWSTSQNPTVADSHTTDSDGIGIFNSNITGLTPNTTYYVKAYATNSEGTAYGEPRVLTTSCTTINESIVVTACDSYTWNGTTYTQTGNYIQQFQTSQGCDSVVEMSLTVIPSPQIHLTYLDNVCPGSEEVDFTMQVISTYSEAPYIVQQTSDFDADRNDVLTYPNNHLFTHFSKPYAKIEDFMCGNTYHLYYTVADANGCIVRDTATFTAYDSESPILGGWTGSPLYQRLEPKRGLNCTYNSLSKAEFVMAFLGKVYDDCAYYDSAYLYNHSEFYWESSDFGYTLAYDNMDIFGDNVGNTLTVTALVWDDCGNVADTLAFWFERPVSLALEPVITIDSDRICLGETAYLYFDSTAVASDPHSELAHPLSFLWNSPDDDINFSIINSVNTSVVPSTGDKVYHVNMTVSDAYGCTVTSDPVELFVKAAPMIEIIPVSEYGLQPPYCPTIGVLYLAAVSAVDSSFVPNLSYTWTSTHSMFVEHDDTTLLYVIPDSCSYIYDKQVFVTDTIYGCTAEASILIPVVDQAPNYIGEEHFDSAYVESACVMTVTDFTHYVTPSTIENVCGIGFNQYTIWQEPPVGTVITEETPVCVYISTPCREDTSKIMGKFKNIPNANSLSVPVYEVIPNHYYTAPYDGIIRLRGVPRGYTYRLYNNSAELVETQIPAWDAESDTTTVVFDELNGNVTYMVKITSTQGCETIFDVYVPTYFADIVVSASSIVNTICDNEIAPFDGKVIVTIDNYVSSMNYTVILDNVDTVFNASAVTEFTGLNAGVYSYKVVNNFYYEYEGVVEVEQQELPDLQLTQTPNTLSVPTYDHPGNGTITVLPPYDDYESGNFAYAYYYAPIDLFEQGEAVDVDNYSLTQTMFNLIDSLYFVVVLDLRTGCVVADTITVGNSPINIVIDEKSCPAAPTVTDIDGNVYSTVQVGEQCWMRENMRTTRYADGTAIACSSTGSITTAYRYYPNHDSANVAAYGYLYNWFAVMNYVNSTNLTSGIVQGVCPNGWHVPSDSDWVQLLYYVSSQNIYGCHNNSNNISKAMASTTGWDISSIECATGYNQSSNNATGFSTFPAGCFRIGYQSCIGKAAYLWSTTEYSGNAAYGTYVDFDDTIMQRVNNLFKEAGLTVRCLRDNVPCDGSYSSVVVIDTTVCMGSQVTFTSSGDTNTISYIWYSDGVEITGENEANITVNFDVAGTYLYVVKAVNNEGCVSVDSILINVSEPPATPQITVDNQVICNGGQITLMVTNPDNNAFYTWYRNGVAIYGAVSATITEAPVTVDGESSNYEYTVIANLPMSGCISSQVSSNVIVTVVPPPTVSVSVEGNTTLCEGGSTILHANVTPSNANYSYQWYKDNVSIEYASMDNCVVAEAARETAYNYSVVVSDMAGCSVTADAPAITFVIDPIVNVSINNNISCVGGSAILTADVECDVDDANFTFEWYNNNTELIGTTAEYTTTGNEEAGYYSYWVIVSADAYGCMSISQPVNYTVIADPDVTIVRLPDQPQTVCDGGNTSIRALVVGGYGESSYQWYKNGSILVGETNQVLNINMLNYGVNDVYSVEVTQTGTGCSTVGSANINSLVTVVPDYTINITGFGNVCEGGSCTLSSTVTDIINDDVLSYQWYKVFDNGNAIAINGATMAQYTTSDLLLSGSYDYFVVVGSSLSGCSLASGTVSVNVVPNPTIILSADNTIMCVGGVATLSATTNVNNTIPGNFNYDWVADDDTITSVTEQFSHTMTDPGVHTFKVRAFMDNNSGCASNWSAPVIIHVAEQPVVVLSSTESLSLCEGGSITMTAAVTNYSNTVNGVTNSDVYGAMTYSWASNGTPLTYDQAQITTILNNIGNYSYQVIVDPVGYYCQPQASNIQVVNVVGDPSWTEVLVYGSNGNDACLGDIVTLEAEVQGGLMDNNEYTHDHIQWIVTDSDGNVAVISGGLGGSSYDIPTAAGTYTYTPTFVENLGNGCQLTNNNAFQETVTVHELTSAEIAVSACDSYTWNDSTYYISGDYTQTFYNLNNCDSTVTLHLTVYHSTHNVQTEVVCDSYFWHGTTYTQSGTYTYDYTNTDGCSSTDTLNLTVNHSADSTLFITVLENNLPYYFNGIPLYWTGMYSDTMLTFNGCDSILTLNLTVLYNVWDTIVATTCDSYEWNGITYTQSGDYTQQFTTVYGTDSIVILHLTVVYSNTTDLYVTACDSYTWKDVTYTVGGDYTDYMTNVNGCDSIVTLHLTINYSDTVDFYATACNSYNWNGETYTESGDYSVIMTNAMGCDLVTILHLTVNETRTSEFTVISSDSCYTWNDITYCNSGDYIQTFQTSDGCDSIVTLHLTITVGIDDHELTNSMVLFPNPTNNIVNVQLVMNQNLVCSDAEIQLFDMFGKFLQTVYVTDETTRLDLSSYASGVYFVKAIVNGTVISVRKVVRN